VSAEERADSALTAAPVFPPALVQLLRERLSSNGGLLADVADDVIIQLLTTVFFAGLETYEGQTNPLGVAFLGKSRADFVMPKGVAPASDLLYQWKVLRFDLPRPFAIGELVKLAVAGVDRRIYSAVHELGDGRLAITGLARAGLDGDSDPVLRIIASRPGCLSIHCGRDLLLAYERGTILTGGEARVFSAGPVRHVLEEAAVAAGLDSDAALDYLNAVRSIVREIEAHGRGGILILSPEKNPEVGESATYKMVLESSLAALLRLVRRIKGTQAVDTTAANSAFGHLLRNALVTEVQRVIEEFGALSGIDGAILLNCDLALIAFGVILPVDRSTAVVEAVDAKGLRSRIVDLGSRGTRHRASVTYAARHPGSVVFVASEDGQVSCLFRASLQHQVRLWRLGASDLNITQAQV
jgi:hypothetical protein